MATLASISYAIAFAKTFVDLASSVLASIAHRVGRTEAEPLAGTAQTSFIALTACAVNNAIRRGRSSGSCTVCLVRPTNWCARQSSSE